MILKEKHQENFEKIFEKYWNRRDAFLKLNPAGTLPVMIINDDIVIKGLIPSIEYLDDIELQPLLISGTAEQKAHIRYVIEWFANKFYTEVTQYIINEKILKLFHDKGSPNSSAIRAAKKNLLYHLDYIVYLLNDNDYICGEKITASDFIAAAQLSVLDMVGDIPWDYNKQVKDWYSLMKSRPSFSNTLNNPNIGINLPSHYLNPDF